ncbi:MAG: HpaII family restriction endonuclease [Mucilaginibacter sp.]
MHPIKNFEDLQHTVSNAASNFTFAVTGKTLSRSEINEINSINSASNISDRIKAIYSNGCILELQDIDNQIFKNNLILIDSLLPEILSNAIIAFYKNGIVALSDISNQLVALNPLKYNQSLNHKFYEHKLKRFLSEVALGMMPNTIWTGLYDGTEGYLIVKKDGDVICYHIINRNLFEDYLLENTKMETPSSTRHGFGQLFIKNGDLFIKLNLQIRFK